MTWGVLELEVPELEQDEWLAVLAGDALGAQVDCARPGWARLSIYLGSVESARAAAESAAQRLRRRGLDAADCRLQVEPVEDGAWVERYQGSLHPFALGRRFEILPTGRQAGVSRRTPIVLVPGRAFGTGEHPTTRLCVEELERRVRPASRWLDVGCGTGLLALVAVHLGAGVVEAVDCDPEAIACARAVLEANGQAARVGIRLGSLATERGGDWHGVVANLDVAALSAGAESLARLPRAVGWAIVSGFEPGDATEIVAALEGQGLVCEAQRELDGWCVAALRRVAGDD